MLKDPIVEEIRRVRDEYAKSFDYDLHAICEDLRKSQKSCGHKIVRREPRKPIGVAA